MIIPFSFLNSGYVFQNAQAQTYWNALITAGFTEANCLSLYSISFNTMKAAIDSCFVSLNADGILSQLITWRPCIGGDAATHAINAVNPGTNNMTFGGTNAVTHSNKGFVVDGTNYGNGIVPSGNMSQNSFSVGCVAADNYRPGATIHLFGAQTTASANILKFRINLVSNNVQFASSTNTNLSSGTDGGSNKGLWIISRSASNASELNRDGVTFLSSATASVALTIYEIIYGGLNSTGTKTGSYIGAIRHTFATNALLASHSNFNSRLATLDAALNRTI